MHNHQTTCEASTHVGASWLSFLHVASSFLASISSAICTLGNTGQKVWADQWISMIFRTVCGGVTVDGIRGVWQAIILVLQFLGQQRRHTGAKRHRSTRRTQTAWSKCWVPISSLLQVYNYIGLINRRTQLILWWIDVYYLVLNYMFRRYGHLQVDDF